MLTKVKRVKNRAISKGALGKGQQTKLKLKVSDCQITLSSEKGYFKFESRRGIGLVFCAKKVIIFESGRGRLGYFFSSWEI